MEELNLQLGHFGVLAQKSTKGKNYLLKYHFQLTNRQSSGSLQIAEL